MPASTFPEAKRWLFNRVSLLVIASTGVARAGDEPLSAIGHYSQEMCKGARSGLRGQWRRQSGWVKCLFSPENSVLSMTTTLPYYWKYPSCLSESGHWEDILPHAPWHRDCVASRTVTPPRQGPTTCHAVWPSRQGPTSRNQDPQAF